LGRFEHQAQEPAKALFETAQPGPIEEPLLALTEEPPRALFAPLEQKQLRLKET